MARSYRAQRSAATSVATRAWVRVDPAQLDGPAIITWVAALSSGRPASSGNRSRPRRGRGSLRRRAGDRDRARQLPADCSGTYGTYGTFAMREPSDDATEAAAVDDYCDENLGLAPDWGPAVGEYRLTTK